MEECFRIRADLLEKTNKRLIFVMDLLVKAEKEEDHGLAIACEDILNWQMKEILDEDRYKGNQWIPFEHSLWLSAAKECKDKTLVFVDSIGRKNFAAAWIGMRGMVEKKFKRSIGLSIAIGASYDRAVGLRDRAVDMEEEEATKRLLPTVGKLTKDIFKNLKLDDKEVVTHKAIGCPKQFLEWSRKVLSMGSLRHQAGAAEDLEAYKEAYDRWVSELFDYYHSRKGVEKLNVITMTTLDYSDVKKLLLNYNVFEDINQSLKRPEGTYPEVKESDYYVKKFLLWKMSQGLYEIDFKMNWDIDVEDKLVLQVTIMQIFCLLCEQGMFLKRCLSVVEDYKASADKVKFATSLNEVRKEVLRAFNQVTLHMYRWPHMPLVDAMEKYGYCVKNKKEEGEENIEEEEEEEEGKLNEAAGGQVKEKVQKSGLYRYRDAEELLNEIYEETEKKVKEMDCSGFKKCLSKVTKEENKKFQEVVDRFGLLDVSVHSGQVYAEIRLESFLEGLKSVLRHHLKSSEEL